MLATLSQQLNVPTQNVVIGLSSLAIFGFTAATSTIYVLAKLSRRKRRHRNHAL